MRIVLTGGGTGGLLVPLVAVAKKIKEHHTEAEFLFIGPNGTMEKKIIGEAGIPAKGVVVGKFRRYFSWRNFIDVAKVPLGIIQALWLMLVYMPDAVFSKGGYASLPVVLVGWLYRIPVFIHESDAMPGLANTFLARFSERVAVSYSQAEKYFPPLKVVFTGSPLRENITQGDAAIARSKFSLVESKKVIFIYGGSQGARNINNRIVNILPELLRKYQIIHQTGTANYEEVVRKAGELGIKAGREGYHPVAFIGEELKDILAVADLAIFRAGSSSIQEAAATGKPAILIPLPTSANDHQRMNAYAVAKDGGCVVLEEENLGEDILMNNIEEIMNDEELRNKLSTNIRTFYHPEATERIAKGIIGMI